MALWLEKKGDFFPWLQDENFQGGQVPAPWTNYCGQRVSIVVSQAWFTCLSLQEGQYVFYENVGTGVGQIKIVTSTLTTS